MRPLAFAFLLCALCAISGRSVHAGARRFTYVYETTTSAPGSFETENWITFQTHTGDDPHFRAFDFRHEIEFGVTDHLQAATYLADWNHERTGFSYTGSALELVYSLTNPVTDPLGLAVYEEVKAGRRFFESESKLLAQKNIGRFVASYNLTMEATWEGEGLDERAGEFQQALGVSYEIGPRLSVGAECVHEIAFPDWSTAQPSVVFAGPDVSVRVGRCWGTATALAQLTGAAGEPDLQVRTIFGYAF